MSNITKFNINANEKNIQSLVLQTTGDDDSLPMSQKAVTESLNKDIEIKSIDVPSFDIEFKDQNNDTLVTFVNGHIQTKNFNSNVIPDININSEAYTDLSIKDNIGNIILNLSNGHIQTKNFNSELLQQTNVTYIDLPQQSIPIYAVCNDIDKSNKWGITTYNEEVSVYLDHFFSTDVEVDVKFNKNNSNYYTLYPTIIGTSTPIWNNNTSTVETYKNLRLNTQQFISIKFRSVLNSQTQNIFPKVLQIGDSVTQGWFANYPVMENVPSQSWAWAHYFFLRDCQQINDSTKYKSLFVGKNNKSSFNFNGISGTAFAHGIGGSTSKMYNQLGSDFYNPTTGKFSLNYYVSKYKTLSDDGVTRLTVGENAGSEVSDVNSWDLCTPNIVVLQLGTNDNEADWKLNMPDIISSIKEEYPDMKIIISVLSACSCNYPSLYPDWNNIYFDNYKNIKEKLLNLYKYAIDNFQDENNGIYVIYSGCVMPMPYSCNYRELSNTLDKNHIKYVGVDSIERVPHPNRYGHKAIGYELYSMIKYIMLK